MISPDAFKLYDDDENLIFGGDDELIQNLPEFEFELEEVISDTSKDE